MRIGFITPHSPERIAFARTYGFRSVELHTGLDLDNDPAYMPGQPDWQAKALRVRADFEDAGLRISCIASFYLNHMDPAIADRCKQRVRNVIQLAEFMGVPAVAGFAGRVMGVKLEESLPAFAEIWGEHAKFAEDHGVKIAFEGCPMGDASLTGTNCICTPEMYERCFDAVDSDALGLEYDPSHLIPLLVDPVDVVRRFGSRIYHVHAKGARVNWDVVKKNGIRARGACEHCMPGFGDEDWGQIIKELRRAGYHGDLNIEGWHDAVFRDKSAAREDEDAVVFGAGAVPPKLEDVGLVIAKNHLEQWAPVMQPAGVPVG